MFVETVTVISHIKNIGIFLTGSQVTVTVQYSSQQNRHKNGLHLVKVLYSWSLGKYSFLRISEEAAIVGR